MQDLNKEKFELIDELTALYSDRQVWEPIALLRHSIVNTIGLSELVKIYIHQYSGNKLLERNIIKRLPDYENRLELYEYIFNELKQSTYINRLCLRKMLDIIFTHLDNNYKHEYFLYFYNSKYLYEIRSALKIVDSIWDKSIQTMLLYDYYNTSNLDILSVLIRKFDSQYVFEFAKSTWTSDLPNYIKRQFANRLKGASLENISFINEFDPNTFLFIAKFSNEAISDEMALDCYNRIPKRHRPFAIYNLGRMGKWNLIKPLVQNYISNPDNEFDGFSEVMFEG